MRERRWREPNGFRFVERRADKSRGGGRLDKIGSDAASSAQLRGMDGGGEVSSGTSTRISTVRESGAGGSVVCVLESTLGDGSDWGVGTAWIPML